MTIIKKLGMGRCRMRRCMLIMIALLISCIIVTNLTLAEPSISTDKGEYYLGEKVMITINEAPADATVKIIAGENIYRFIGELNHSMEFMPSATGEYIVSLEYGYSEAKAFFKVNPQPEFPLEQEIINRVYSPEEIMGVGEGEESGEGEVLGEGEVAYYSESPFDAPLMPEQGSQITISKDWFTIKGHDQLEIDKGLEIYDFMNDKKYLSSESSFATPLGVYDALIRLENHPIKSVLFRNLEIPGDTGLELRIDDLTGNVEKAGENSKQFYVIDPTSLDFTEAYVTVAAKGNVLRKCKEWNYEEQRCYGTWEYVMDIVPGEDYTFILTPEDPAYNETTHNADNCYNEKAARVCTADEITAISANGGTSYTFNKNSGSPIRVSFSNESANITEVVSCTVYVDGYSNEANTWTLQTGNWSTNTWYTGTGQTAPNPEGTRSWNCTSHFTRQNNDDALFDNFAVRISTNDGGGPANAYLDYIYVVINFSVQDQTPPYYSGITAAPTSPATYSPTANYQFNTTWQDNEDIYLTWIEHNFTGSFANASMSRLGDVSYFNYGVLAAGSYSWKTYANDSAGNINNTMPWQSYIVNKASSQLTLLLNSTSANFTVNNSGTANITAIVVAGEGNVSIYENGISLVNGTNRVTIIRSYSAIGDYNITAVYAATQNYTASSTTYYVNVKDTIPPGPVTNLRETANSTSWILWNWTNPADADFHHVEVWIDGEFKLNTTNQYYNASGLLASTQYEIQIRAVDNRSPANIGSFVNDTAWTQASSDTTPPAITNVQNTSITDSSATISWSTDEIADSIVKYGTSPGVYTYTFTNFTLTMGHVAILTSLLSGTPYYYVVNSSDSNGNSNQSMEYTFTTLGDQTAPWYSGIAAAPASPATFNATGTYQFNTTWQDNQAVDKVWIEHNFTGVMQNYTFITNHSNTFYYNYGAIGVGSYIWKMHSNDSAGNKNSTMPWQAYYVTKASSQIALLMNGTPGNYSINESQGVNITGQVLLGEGSLKLFLNETLINQGQSPLTSLITFYAPGTYNITLVYEETYNYTANSTTYFVAVNDTRAPWVTLIDPPDTGVDIDGDMVFTFYVNDTSDVMNCSLYINGTYNQEKEIITSGQNTFTLNGLTNSNYTWYVNCSDHAGHYNVSDTWNFTVHISEYYPFLRPAECSDNNGCTLSNINNTPGTWEEHGTLQKGTSQANYVNINFSQPAIPAGSTVHWMYIYYNKYQTTTSGFLRLDWLNGTSWVTICSQAFGSATAYANDSVNCSFTNATMPNLTQINNGIQLRAEFYYSDNPAGVTYGTDEVYIHMKYTEDVTPPVVELIGPNSYHRPGEVNFTYIPEDANLVNCTLWGDFDGITWQANISDTEVISGQIDNFTINLSEGFYTWNVKCCDIANNCGFDLIGGLYNDGNYTVNITNPDLIVSQIAFNTTSSSAREGMSITINATIKNQGNVNATETFKVQFFLGDPDSGGTQIGENQSISELNVNENKTVNTTWIIDRGGPRNIYVVVDPPLASEGVVKETKEDNNKNNNTLNVPTYNYFYGQAEQNIYLGNDKNDSIYYYLDIINVSGNIMVADAESTISFADLQALGRDTSNNPADDDFNETDSALNMTGFEDSIRKLYTQDTDTPIATQTFNIFGQSISNVPIVESTNNSNFITGILWDKSDTGTEYTGTQDLVFITQINLDKEGTYGIADYEIRVPVNLKKYIDPPSSVIFYTEINQSASE